MKKISLALVVLMLFITIGPNPALAGDYISGLSVQTQGSTSVIFLGWAHLLDPDGGYKLYRTVTPEGGAPVADIFALAGDTRFLSQSVSGAGTSTVTYYLEALDAGGGVLESSHTITVPETPTNFAVTNDGGGTSVTLSWDAVAGADSYNIRHSTGDPWGTTATTVTGTTCQVTGLTANTSYNFRVTTVIGGDEGFAAAQSFTPTDTTPPAGPTGLAVKSDGSPDTLHLTWTANGESDLAGYNVYRRAGAEVTFTKVNASLVARTDTWYFDSSAVASEATYYVTAVDSAVPSNESGPSATVDVAGPPTGFVAADRGDPSGQIVDLSWDAVWADVSEGGYNVYYRRVDSAGDFTKFNDGAGLVETTSCTISGLATYTHYEFRVAAEAASAAPDGGPEGPAAVDFAMPTDDPEAPAVAITTPSASVVGPALAAVGGTATDNAAVAGIALTITKGAGPDLRYWDPHLGGDGAWTADPAEFSFGVATPGPSVAWSYAAAGWLVEEVDYTVSAVAVDAAERRSNADSVTFTYDATAPDATITSPTPSGCYIGTTTPVFEVDAFDAVGLAAITFGWVAGVDNPALPDSDIDTVTSPDNGTYVCDWGTASLPATDGVYSLRVTVTDLGGNETVESVLVHLDVNAPEVTLDDIPDYIGPSPDPMTFSGTASDGSGITGVEVRITWSSGGEDYYWNGSSWAVAGAEEDQWLDATQVTPGSWSEWTYEVSEPVSTWILWQEDFTVAARATDGYGRTGTAGDIFTYDDRDPSGSATPFAGSFVDTARPYFSVFAQDSLSGVAWVRLGWWDETASVWRYFPASTYDPAVSDVTVVADWNAAGWTLPEGRVEFSVEIRDAVGNETATTFFATVDLGDPAGMLTSPADGEACPAPDYVTGTASDAFSLDRVEMFLRRGDGNCYNGFGWPNSFAVPLPTEVAGTSTDPITGAVVGVDWRYATDWLPDDEYEVWIDVFDTAGRVYHSAPVTFIVDSMAPSVPSGLSVSAGAASSLMVNWSASTDPAPASGGPPSGVAGYDLYVSHSATGPFTKVNGSLITGTTYTHTGLPASVTRWYEVVAVDEAGNRSNASGVASATTWSAVSEPGALFTTSFDPAVGGGVTGAGFSLEAPAGVVEGAVGAKMTVSVRILSGSKIGDLLEGAEAPAGFEALDFGFEAWATLTDGGTTDPVASFDQPVTLRFELTPAQIAGITDPSKVGLFRVNADGSLTFVGGRVATDAAGHTFLVIELWGFSHYVAGEVTLSFNDLVLADGRTHWAKGDIEAMAAKFVVGGMPGGAFEPDASVTRAQFACMLVRAVRALGLEPPTGMGAGAADPPPPLTFTDVRGTDWFYAELSVAVQAGLITGYDDGTFRPGAPITREQVAVMVSRALVEYDLAAEPTPAGVAIAFAGFTDAGLVSDWAERGMALAVNEGIVGGRTDTTLVPGGTASRAEAAAMIARLCRNVI